MDGGSHRCSLDKRASPLAPSSRPLRTSVGSLFAEPPASARRRQSERDLSLRSAAPVEQQALSAVRLGGDPMTVPTALDAAGRRRSPATLPGYHAGRPPRNKGQLYPADPPTVEEIIAVMRRSPRRSPAGADRRALARRAPRPGGARAGRARPRCTAGVAARAPRQGWPSARDRHGRLGLGAAVALARRPGRAAGRAAVLHHRRAHSWPVLVELRGPGRVPSACRPGRSAAAFCAASAAPRPRRRACPPKAWRSTSSSASSATPTSARPASTCRAPTHRGDHRDRARPTRADDVRHRRTPALTDRGAAAGGPAIACGRDR